MGRPGAWRHSERGDRTGPISHQPSLPETWVCEIYWTGPKLRGRKKKRKKDDKSWDKTLKMFKLWEIWGKLFEIITSKNSIEKLFLLGIEPFQRNEIFQRVTWTY